MMTETERYYEELLAEVTRERERYNGMHQIAVMEIERLRKALEWYAGEADAAARYMAGDKATTADALLAILTVLANDSGRRARAVLNRVVSSLPMEKENG